MTFKENVSHIHDMFYNAGFATLNEFYSLDRVAEKKKVIDCVLVAKRGEYEIIYAEVKSNQESIAGDLAKSHHIPCLVITQMNDMYAFTVLDYDSPRNTRKTSMGNKARLNALIDEIRDMPDDMWEANQHITRFIDTMNDFAR